MAHNYYQQPGGEDQVFAAEAKLLEAHGDDVYRYTVHNDDISQQGKFALAKSTIWNSSSYKQLRSILQREQPQILHLHNTLPLISPSAYYAAKAEGVPVVQTLHNYRLLCPNALFYRDQHVCEDCLGKLVTWPGVIHGCYRESRAATSVVASMLAFHRLKGTYTKMVDLYVALSEFAKQKFVEGGFPEEKIVVKPNFLGYDPGKGEGQGGYALFVGRLVKEKGVSTLLKAWQILGSTIPLKIVGDGPLAAEVRSAVQINPSIEWLGPQPRERVLALMREASFLIFPSVWYEAFPVTIVEAFSVGLPVVSSKLGSMVSLIENMRTGLHFQPGNHETLAAQVAWILDHPSELAQMRQAARAEFLANYSAETNYLHLMTIYNKAIALAG